MTALFSRRFLLAFLPMLVLAIGIPPAISALQTHYAKAVIDLRVPLASFDRSVIDGWTYHPDVSPGHIDPRSVGTDEYIYDTFRRPTDDAKTNVDAVLLVTYYSDPDDTIPHTPEVCYRQAGSTIDALQAVPIELDDIGATTARLLDISQPHGAQLIVLYVICHNGMIFHERESARLAMGLPGDAHTYFAKVEVAVGTTPGLTREVQLRAAEDLLNQAFRELRATHFPTDRMVRDGQSES